MAVESDGWFNSASFGVPVASVFGVLLGAALTFGWIHYRKSQIEPTVPSLPNGTQEVAVFIGASWCGASRYPGLRDSVPKLMLRLAREAHTRHHQFESMGIALDQPAQKGIKWLSQYGSFDELIVGNNWANFGAIRFIWSDSLVQPALPQLIVMSRSFATTDQTIKVGHEQILERIYGPQKIMNRLAADSSERSRQPTGSTRTSDPSDSPARVPSR